MTAMPKALVLAAGKSTRIEPISGGRPKPLLPIGGDAILAHNLRWLEREGVADVFINLHHRPEEIRDFVGDGSRFGVSVTYSHEPEIRGTAGAAKEIGAAFGGRFLVVYGDNLLKTDLAALVAAHEDAGAVATVAVFDRDTHPHTGIAGGRVAVDAAGRITEFAEGAGDEISTLVNAGVYVLEPQVLDAIPPATFFDFGKDVFPALLAAGHPVLAVPVTGFCLGLDTPETFAVAETLIQSGKVVLP